MPLPDPDFSRKCLFLMLILSAIVISTNGIQCYKGMETISLDPNVPVQNKTYAAVTCKPGEDMCKKLSVVGVKHGLDVEIVVSGCGTQSSECQGTECHDFSAKISSGPDMKDVSRITGITFSDKNEAPGCCCTKDLCNNDNWSPWIEDGGSNDQSKRQSEANEQSTIGSVKLVFLALLVVAI